MKKIVLFLVTLLAFIGNAWADYTCTLATTEVQVNHGNSNTLSLGADAQVTNITIEIRSNEVTQGGGSPFAIGTTSGGSDLWNDKCNYSQYPSEPTVNKSFSPAKEISAIYFHNQSSSKTRYYRNVTLTIEASTYNFGSVLVGQTSQWTALKVLSGSNTKPTLTSTDERFTVTVGNKTNNYYPVTVRFSPTEGKLYSADIKLGDEVVATVSGTGTRTGECAAQTFNNQTVQRDKTSNAIETSKNEATISFSYSGTGTESKVRLYLEESETGTGNWSRIWSEEGKASGTASVALTRGYRFFRFGNNYNSTSTTTHNATFSNIRAEQAVYFEPNDTPLNFGTLAYGASESRSVNVDFSAMSGDVTCSNPYFTFSPDVVGAAHGDNCEYGSQTVTVTFNANGETPAGIYNATLYIGETPISLSATVLPLPAPVVQVTDVRSTAVSVSWNSVSNASSYTIYQNGVAVQTGVTGTSYQFTGLNQATQYSFSVKSVRGAAESELSDAVSATTYTTSMDVTITGTFGPQGTASVTSTAWNESEESYGIGSTATVTVTSLPEDCVVESIVANGIDITSTATFEVQAENSVVITYRYDGTGVVEVVDEHGDVIYGTLSEAVEAAEDGATLKLLADVEQDMVVNKNIKLDGKGYRIYDLIIKKNGNVELIGNISIQDFGLEVAPDKAGQYSNSSSELSIRGDAYIDVKFDNVKRDKWYAFTVPFPVNMYGVLDAQTLSPLVYGSDYIFLGFDGGARAAGATGWVRYNDPETLVPGQLYMIGTDGSIVHRFYKIDGEDLVSPVVSFYLESHTSTKGENLSNWNALGNTQLFNVDADHDGTQFEDDVIAQVYQSASDSYLAVKLKEHVMSVTSPIFIQKTDNCSKIDINKTDALRSANAESALYNLQIAKEGAVKIDDRMFVSASDNAPSKYVVGYALMKLGLTNSIAQIYSKMYNTNLCMINAPYAANGVADIPLTLFAPAAGNYTLSLDKPVSDGTALYLVKDGAEIHEFNADGSYTVYLAKGASDSYSLRLKSTDGEDITTPAAETEANGIKAYVKESVLVIEGLAEGGSYAVGNMIRTLYSGTSNGGDVRIPLTEKGVYWVNAGIAKVKVLNK
ncbi:MAG: fibronectin type III domain-containing protein [Paludibacteraceae bacterium]|nr:fibronectin type III domain-containing protein [Paludibacteraceae bacterium]